MNIFKSRIIMHSIMSIWDKHLKYSKIYTLQNFVRAKIHLKIMIPRERRRALKDSLDTQEQLRNKPAQ